MIAIIIIVAILLCPVLCCCYAGARYGPRNASLWFRYKACHTNPTIPIFYMPAEDRNRIKRRLGIGKAKDGASRSTTKDVRLEEGQARLEQARLESLAAERVQRAEESNDQPMHI